MEVKSKPLLKIILLFFPILIYFGNRSPIAFDEGYYILQSKWILLTNDWVSPTYWGRLVLDRTIGIQYLLALSQRIFGQNNFAIYLPTFISGIIMLFLTSQIHKDLVEKKNQIFSVLILSTTYLWINYFHMATQDIVFASTITFGIFSSIKAYKTKKNYFIILSGIWIGLAVMLKTYLTVIPLLAILPFLISTKIINSRLFWVGALLGFLPFFVWSYKIISIYDFQIFSGLYSKLLTLSNNNNFTNPFYYYLWNLPANTFPWCLFSVIGFFNIYKLNNKVSHYFLFKYPLIIMVLLSIFSTKTPYYPIQILPLISINSFLGIKYLYKKRNLFTIFLNQLYFTILPLFLISFTIYINFISRNIELKNYFNLILSISLILFALFWLISAKINSFSKKIILILLGPYLLLSISVQSGFLNDRSKDIRIVSKEIIKKENLYEKKVEFITTGPRDEESTSKLIRIAIFMPKIGQGKKSLEELSQNQHAWTTIPAEEILLKKEFKLLSDSSILAPWKLIIKK